MKAQTQTIAEDPRYIVKVEPEFADNLAVEFSSKTRVKDGEYLEEQILRAIAQAQFWTGYI